jgi:hypothetical protein
MGSRKLAQVLGLLDPVPVISQPGYVDINPGAGTSHIDFYNGDSTADCTTA